MWKNSELEYAINEDGDRAVKMVIGSNMLPHITIDTYQMFTSDAYEENEVDYFVNESGYDLEPDDLDISYGDHAKVVETLAEWCRDAVGAMCAEHGVAEVGEVVSTFSPAAYNFATDSFEAEYTLNLSALMRWGRQREEWGGERLEDAVDSYLRERYSSCDGFISYVIPALDGRYHGDRLATLVWGLFHAWMEFEFDQEAWFYAMLEDDYTLWSDFVTFKFTADGYEKNREAVALSGDYWLVPEEYSEECKQLRADHEAIQAQTPLPGL